MKYIFSLLFITNFVFSQTLSSSLNRESVELGESITMKISIQNRQGKKIVSAQKNGLLPFHFEETKDEIEQDENQYIRTIKFSIFEEGIFTIPALEFKIGDSIHTTIPYEIEVRNSANPNEEISDIMPNKEVELEWSDYWELYKNYFFVLLGIIAVGLLFIFFKKHRKNTPKKQLISPNKILNLLAQLKEKKYIENEQYKEFYTEFLEIIRMFLEMNYQIPAKILLTDDLLEYIQKEPQISMENQQMLAEIFTRGDLVKFAKTIPNQDVMREDFNKVENWIKSNLKSQ